MNQMELSEETLLTALEAWNLSLPLTIRHLTGGFTSEIWRVETGDGCFITKYSEQSQEAFEQGLRTTKPSSGRDRPSISPTDWQPE